ncbi:hypothetical protein [Acinetobacter sp. MD2(2019)]|uniref:hypothetical protein n=1 Tax=Acinetobacter sp. MD2(2019) TaxID=2605273 RepID=UPI002D1F16C4|nr:hypothetical protein [Acinetobacter sp. MD2(2019)]MEB3753096.1 hypothetical protein [Acinetobacter sp. MD2(2019)]
MQITKYFIPEFYIKNTVISFIFLCLLAGVVNFILDQNLNFNEYIQIGIATVIGMLGLILIGYYNTLSAYQAEKKSKALFLHIFLILCFLITDCIWSQASFLTIFLRNLAYFLLLEFGVFIYKKRAKVFRSK